jgi:hypothetical protein
MARRLLLLGAEAPSMKIDPTRVFFFTSVVLATVAPACALRPPVQNGGAATDPSGVEIAVVGQSCTETVETDLPGVNLVEATVEVQVRNAAPPPLVVHRDAFRLRGPDGRAIPTTTWRASDPLSIEAGQASTFELRFMTRGGLSCTKPMQLEASAGITKGAEPVRLGAVSFVPSHA